MATHSSVLAWRIPGAGEPGGLMSMGSHRVGHDWSDLAAAAAGRVLGTSFNYHSIPTESYSYYPHFTDESTEWNSQNTNLGIRLQSPLQSIYVGFSQNTEENVFPASCPRMYL